jgi:hypothetical protein
MGRLIRVGVQTKMAGVRILALGLLLGLCVSSVHCTQFGAVYPPRPPESPGEPLADPSPSRVVVHAQVSAAAMKKELETAVPRTGDGTFPALGGERSYTWTREDLELDFSQGRVVIHARVQGHVKAPVIGTLDFPLDLVVSAEPVVSTGYAVKLQSLDVKVSSSDRRLGVADKVTPVYEKIETPIRAQLRAFSYDLRPLMEQANQRIAKPTQFPVGDATACARLRVLGIEAGPTVIADGLEKDIALIVMPEVTMPCPAETEPPPIPDLANVASVATGPFTVTIPIAARYEELARAMSVTFTDGKFFFSKDFPELYLEKPELYESDGKLVLKMHLHGPVHAHGIDAKLDGELFFTGHPTVTDNELQIADLEPTIETASFLLALKAETDGANIRDTARKAMRLDVAARLLPVKEKLNSALNFGGDSGCFRATVDKIEVKELHSHAAYLRMVVAVTARASLSMPCPTR